MNVFALMFLVSPIMGAAGGGIMGNEYSVLLCILGVILGLLIGVGLYYGSLYLIAFLNTLFKVDKSEKLNVIQWIVSFSSVIVIPIATCFLSLILSSISMKLLGDFTSH